MSCFIPAVVSELIFRLNKFSSIASIPPIRLCDWKGEDREGKGEDREERGEDIGRGVGGGRGGVGGGIGGEMD